MKGAFKILLVDDKQENIIALEHMLAQNDREFLIANNGNDALKQLLRNSDVALVMLDVQMPDMDGFEVASLIKSNPKTQHVAIIFVTAINKEPQYILKGFEGGAVDYLSKPLDVQVTRAKVAVFEKLYRYQNELQVALKEKEDINKQLERFMYVVAHDLKSPLSGMLSMMDYIRTYERDSINTTVDNYLQMCVDAAHHLNGMISSVLEYSRKANTEQQVELVDTHALVSEMIRLLFPPPNIRISIDGFLPVIHGNKLKIHQVFQNFVSNAIKHNDKMHGEITIGFKGPEKGYYTFYVKDNGPGIKREDHQRIFKLFETVDKNDPNDTGIGLNVIKLFVEERGGKITVDSEPNQGSTFYFTWPE
ncbi:ATP-binding protein [Sphingobacterium corticis]|uniref:histidine kinase n=1 Tax=Sphingobacterium corticis TaxID=1812823 RepID=A0ABW5NJD0_9SPHI